MIKRNMKPQKTKFRLFGVLVFKIYLKFQNIFERPK